MTDPTALAPGSKDFDFLHGRWEVEHRRLASRLTGDTNWESFTGTCESWPLLGGLGNVDDNLLRLPQGEYRAATVRTFDPAAGLWSIWWIDGRQPQALDPPVRGRFEGGVGLFLGDETLNGRPIRVRFTWRVLDPASARWEQAFSVDGGQTWEPNWEMLFTRRG